MIEPTEEERRVVEYLRKFEAGEVGYMSDEEFKLLTSRMRGAVTGMMLEIDKRKLRMQVRRLNLLLAQQEKEF